MNLLTVNPTWKVSRILLLSALFLLALITPLNKSFAETPTASVSTTASFITEGQDIPLTGTAQLFGDSNLSPTIIIFQTNTAEPHFGNNPCHLLPDPNFSQCSSDFHFTGAAPINTVDITGVLFVQNLSDNTTQTYNSDTIHVPVCPTGTTSYDSSTGCAGSTPPPCVTDCFSNVLFLPGFEGSILKTGSDTLWPPTVFSNDIPQLALNSDGTSINDIHVDGILNEFYIAPIYAPFSNFMDSISGDNKLINEWLPLAYDWRFSPEKNIENGIKTSSGTIDVINKIEELAANSKTGKVTIVAHSMGGLFGKVIIKKLQDEGKDNLIDSFVMVATPQLGTPQTIGSVLHGDSTSIAAGFITNSVKMRLISQNMQSAYDLLPSSRYFNEVSDSVITFDPSAPFTKPWRDFWGDSINSYSSFLSFVTATDITRTKPAESVLRIPEILSLNSMTNAESFHSIYDNYQFPSPIHIVQIAGWGIPTVKSINYNLNHLIQGYDVNFTTEGDKTVVYSSATSSSTNETYFFNLSSYRGPDGKIVNHSNLLGTTPIEDVIKSVIKNENILESNFITKTKPSVINIGDSLVVSTKSPVVLGAYDEFGHFTGIDPNQDLSADVLSIKEDIPGSIFTYTSESQYIFLPKSGTYNFIYKGTGNGPTTVVVNKLSANITTPIISFTDIPTTPSTNANFALESSIPENTSIKVDVDGDGHLDNIIPADGVDLSLNELIVLVKEKISTLIVKDKIKQNLLKQVSSLEKKIDTKKQKNIKTLASLKQKISNQEIKGKINTIDATGITTLLDLLEAESDSIVFDSVVLADLKAKIQSLTIKANLKSDLLKRAENLEKKQALIKNLYNLSKNITNKANNGKISDTDAQTLVDLLVQIEGVI